MTIIVFDQFGSINPAGLQRSPIQFNDLLQHVQDDPDGTQWGVRRPTILGVTEEYSAPWATTIVREGEGGRAEVWKTRWDSSG